MTNNEKMILDLGYTEVEFEYTNAHASYYTAINPDNAAEITLKFVVDDNSNDLYAYDSGTKEWYLQHDGEWQFK